MKNIKNIVLLSATLLEGSSVLSGEILWKAGDFLQWETGEAGLPEINVLAEGPQYYPPNQPASEGGMPDTDPWFILGNYGLTVFPHVSGSYQLFHTEQGFARLNFDANSGLDTGRACRSTISVNGKKTDLLETPANEKRFGCGMAKWDYQLGHLHFTRRLDTLPSRDHRDRIAGFTVTLEARNTGDTPLTVDITEGLGVRYDFTNWHHWLGRIQARYPVFPSATETAAMVQFKPEALRPLVFAKPGYLAQADGYPPNVHLEILEGSGHVQVEKEDDLCAWMLSGFSKTLQPGESATFRVAVGWSSDTLNWADTRAALDVPVQEMRAAWAKRLPSFSKAKDEATRAELKWHAYVLHAMATWDSRFKTTYIPQGNLYEYILGSSSCTRDQAMHGLPACSYDPDLAHATLSYLARRTEPTGRVLHTVEGAGIYPVGGDQKSDNELYCLLLAAEYFDRTGDNAALGQQEMFYPPMGDETPEGTLLERIGLWVGFLRDGIHVGKNGLIRIMHYDISDTLGQSFDGADYGAVFNGESYVNTTMALNVLRRLGEYLNANADQLGWQREQALEVAKACEDLEGQLRKALFSDLEGRPWVPRGRVGDKILGAQDAFSVPQAFILSNPDLPESRRLEIWSNVRPRIWDNEPFGVLLREGVGEHRCGTVWYAWSGLFINELAAIDPDAAREGFERLSLRRRAKVQPDQWVGLWSNSDCTWGYSLDWKNGTIPGTCRVGYMKRFPHFCAHAHAWPLMIWHTLNRKE